MGWISERAAPQLSSYCIAYFSHSSHSCILAYSLPRLYGMAEELLAKGFLAFASPAGRLRHLWPFVHLGCLQGWRQSEGSHYLQSFSYVIFIIITNHHNKNLCLFLSAHKLVTKWHSCLRPSLAASSTNHALATSVHLWERPKQAKVLKTFMSDNEVLVKVTF